MSILSVLVGPVAGIVQGWMKNRAVKAERNFEITKIRAQGKIDRELTLAQSEADYDNIAQRNRANTWTDEFLILLVSFPYIVSFISPFIELGIKIHYADKITPRIINLTETLGKSWDLIGSAPAWYQGCFIGIIGATFGLRWFLKGIRFPGLGPKFTPPGATTTEKPIPGPVVYTPPQETPTEKRKVESNHNLHYTGEL